MKDYDAVGFDVDNTFVKYNVETTQRVLIKNFLQQLHDKYGYPKEVMDFNYDKDMGVCLNNGIWDIYNGTVLKLDEGRRITHAIRGFKPLTKD